MSWWWAVQGCHGYLPGPSAPLGDSLTRHLPPNLILATRLTVVLGQPDMNLHCCENYLAILLEKARSPVSDSVKSFHSLSTGMKFFQFWWMASCFAVHQKISLSLEVGGLLSPRITMAHYPAFHATSSACGNHCSTHSTKCHQNLYPHSS